MNIDDIYPSRYLKANKLNGHTVCVRIKECKIEEVGQECERKAVLYFENNTQALILNKSNLIAVAEALGTKETEQWRGGRVKLYTATKPYRGKEVPCICVAPAPNPLPGEGGMQPEDDGAF